MPPGFRFEVNSDFWLPAVPTLDPSTRPSIRSMTVIGRLAPGRTIEQLRAELATVETAAGGAPPGERTVIVADPLRARYAASTQSHDVAFAAIVGCVLLIACANLANLMLVRTIHQQREHAIRAALGARARRLVRSIIIQNAIVVVLATLLGVALASASLGVLRALPSLASLRPPGMDYRVDARVLAFATFIAAIAALTISLVPGRVAARGDVQQLLRGTTGRASTGGRGWTQQLFVVAQVACATVLLTGALLMAKTVMHLAGVSLGFESSRLVSGSPSYPHSWRVKDVYMPVTERIIGDLGRLPGVRDVAVRAAVPIAMRNGVPAVTVEQSAEPLPRGLAPRSAQAVSPGYFATMGVAIVRGREFSAHDDEQGAPVAIVNRWAAARWWPNEDAIGHIVRVGAGDSALAVSIVGVAADNKAAQANLLLADDGAELYRPYRQAPSAFPTFFVRATGNPVPLVSPIRELLTRVVPDRPVFTTVMSETAQRQLGGVRANAVQIAGFAIVGLVLAMIGVYGVLSFDMSRRTRELGIRGALGASRGSLTGMVLRDAARMTGLGVLIGVPVAAFAMRVIRGLLYSTNPRDVAVYAGVTACVAAVAMIAAYIPARRAARVDPLIAMRAE
jgi:predicted permease